jgi:hypothetical protein
MRGVGAEPRHEVSDAHVAVHHPLRPIDKHPEACEHAFVSTKGGPHARFRQALDTGNLTLIRSAAAELPQVSLEDALRVCLGVRKAEPETYERAVVRWLGRFCIERRDVTLAAVRVATEALERLPRNPDESVATLRRLVR